MTRERNQFDGHPLECRVHSERPAMSCAACFAADPTRRSDVGARCVLAARALIGTPYAHMGRTRAGLDCTGLVMAARNAAGVPTHYARTYREDLEGLDTLAELMASAPTDRELDRLEEGDAVFFRVAKRTKLGHFGIVTADGTIIAAVRRAKMVIEHQFDYRWAERAAIRVPIRGGR